MLWSPIILAGGTIVAAIITVKLNKIHTLVNSKMTDALNEIKRLNHLLEIEKEKNDDI